MVWSTNYPNLPYPTGGQMNPYHQALQTGLENYMNTTKAAYQPVISMADAASKLAYARLMGPQFMAKLMGNPDIRANINNPQATVNNLQNAAMGQGNNGVALQPDGSNFWDWVKSLSKGSNQSQQSQPQQQQAPQPQQQSANPDSGMAYNSNGTNNVMPSDQVSNIAQNGNSSQPEQKVDVNAVTGNDPNSEIGKATTAWMNSPEGASQAQKNGYYQIPDQDTLLNWYRNRQPADTNEAFAQRAGKVAGIKKQEEEAGTYRAKTVDELGHDYEGLLNNGYAYDRVNKIITNPEFQSLRNSVPFFQDKQLKVLSKIGTPAQQKMIGDVTGSAQEIIRNTINSFKGTRMKGELTIAQNMKVSDDDTFNVMIGKMQAANYYNEYKKQRTELTANLMQNQHMNYQEALQKADKQLNGDKIRNKVDGMLNPMPTKDDINYMAYMYKTTPEEIKKRLDKKGIKYNA